jgi:hypothetical protein
MTKKESTDIVFIDEKPSDYMMEKAFETLKDKYLKRLDKKLEKIENIKVELNELMSELWEENSHFYESECLENVFKRIDEKIKEL